MQRDFIRISPSGKEILLMKGLNFPFHDRPLKMPKLRATWRLRLKDN